MDIEIRKITDWGTVAIRHGKVIASAKKVGTGWMISSKIGEIFESRSKIYKGMTSYRHVKTLPSAIKVMKSL